MIWPVLKVAVYPLIVLLDGISLLTGHNWWYVPSIGISFMAGLWVLEDDRRRREQSSEA
jgi:hypothetical protein